MNGVRNGLVHDVRLSGPPRAEPRWQHTRLHLRGAPHAGDALQAASDEQLLGFLGSLGEQSLPVAEAQAAPYVGEYDYGARVDYATGVLTLSTDFGAVPLQAYAGTGIFVRTGALTGMTLAAFDSASAPTQLTLGIAGGDGLSQPFVLRRVGE